MTRHLDQGAPPPAGAAATGAATATPPGGVAGWGTAAAGEWAGIGEPLAEAAVLGCLLRTTPAHAAGLLEVLTEDDFTVPVHRHVLTAVRELLAHGEPVDPVTVLGQLRRQGIDSAATASRCAAVLLVGLCESAPAVAAAGFYARIVVEHTHRRRVQQAAVRLLHAAEHAPLDSLHTLTDREHAAVTASRHRLPPPPAQPLTPSP